MGAHRQRHELQALANGRTGDARLAMRGAVRMRGRKLIDALNLYASFRELIHRSCAHRAKTDNENIARLTFHIEGAGLDERELSLNLVALARKTGDAYPIFQGENEHQRRTNRRVCWLNAQ